MVQFDIEEPKNEAPGVQSRPSIKEVDKKACLSVVSRQYDVDGDGVLDEAEQALRNLDKSGRGFLKTDEVYSIMNDHLKMQKDMFKMKKVIGGLVAFTVLLALSNLGTSLAAAWLSKDTSTSNGSLVDKATSKTLSTQQEKEKFQAKPVSEERRRELVEGCNTSRRKLGNGNSGGNGSSGTTTCTVNSYLEVDHAHGQTIIEDCANGNTVSICRDFKFDGTDQRTNVCTNMCDTTMTFQATDNGLNGSNKVYTEGKTDVNKDGTIDCTITCPGSPQKCVLQGSCFKHANGGRCDIDSDCVSNNCSQNTCEIPLVIAEPEPAPVAAYGTPCRANSDCQSDVCRSTTSTCGCSDVAHCPDPTELGYGDIPVSCSEFTNECEYQVFRV